MCSAILIKDRKSWCTHRKHTNLTLYKTQTNVLYRIMLHYVMLCYWCCLLTPHSTVLIEKLTGFAASQGIPHIFWKPKVHYRIHTYPPHVPILSQLDPVRIPTSNFLKIQLNIILQSTLGFPRWSFTVRFPNRNPVYPTPLPLYALNVQPISFSFLSPQQY